MSIELKKGEVTEEILRDYFLEQGYFVVRGIPYKYNQFDVTDVDLWLYSKPSLLTRERTNVDIKRKKTPQALERIFWTKGLQQVLGLEKCIVATTDTREDVREFGAKHDVIVLDGNFLNRLIHREPVFKDRIYDEELLLLLEDESTGKLGGDWRSKLLSSKSRLLNKLDFDSCNEFLKDIKYLMEQSIVRNHSSQGALRFLYITIAFFLINVDYVVKDYICLDNDLRTRNMINGFRYGQMGKAKVEDITNAAIRLASSVIVSSSISTTLRNEINSQFSAIPAEILSEFFSKLPNIQSLVKNAKLFESVGYLKQAPYPSNLPAELQGIIGLLSDFLHIQRKEILSSNSIDSSQ
jgi:hypothetical protein